MTHCFLFWYAGWLSRLPFESGHAHTGRASRLKLSANDGRIVLALSATMLSSMSRLAFDGNALLNCKSNTPARTVRFPPTVDRCFHL